MLHHLATNLLFPVLIAASAFGQLEGPAPEVPPPDRSKPYTNWHDWANWRAENYFADPQAIAMCQAIEANDLDEMKRLLHAGLDVNTKRRADMTFLLWSFPDKEFERFELLLKRGADPNVPLTQPMPPKGPLRIVVDGDSVTWMATKTKGTKFLKAVLTHGGDANILHPRKNMRPLMHCVLTGKVESLELLAKHGADLDALLDESTPVMLATQLSNYEIALTLLNLGASYDVYAGEETNFKLIHYVAREERRRLPVSEGGNAYRPWNEVQATNHEQLVDWLEAHGEDYKKAQQEEKQWSEWLKQGRGVFLRNMKELYEERIAAEKAAEASSESASNDDQ